MDMLDYTAQKGGSELHITVGVPPVARINGSLIQLSKEKLTPADTKAIIYNILIVFLVPFVGKGYFLIDIDVYVLKNI